MCDRPLLVYSQVVCCGLLRDLDQPGEKDGYLSREQISMFQEMANGRKRNEGVRAKGWDFIVCLVWAFKHTKIARSRGQIAKT